MKCNGLNINFFTPILHEIYVKENFKSRFWHYSISNSPQLIMIYIVAKRELTDHCDYAQTSSVSDTNRNLLFTFYTYKRINEVNH